MPTNMLHKKGKNCDNELRYSYITNTDGKNPLMDVKIEVPVHEQIFW
jgi:hypothetical protein